MSDVIDQAVFDHNAASFSDDMRGQLRELLLHCPVARSQKYGGFWILTSYEHVAMAARDDKIFSSARHPAGSELASTMIPQIPTPPLPPFEMDPPESTKLRRLLTRMMSPAEAEKVMVPLLAQVVDFCLDQVVEAGRCDLIEDVAGSISALFTLVWLGIPTPDWQRFVRLQHNAVSYPHDAPEYLDAVADYSWQSEIIAETIKARRAKPTSDAITFLLSQEIDGLPLDDDLVNQIVGLLIAGGTHTLSSLTGQSIRYLNDRHEVRDQLLKDDQLVGTAIEEFLRYFTPAPALARTVMTDVEVGGRLLHAGDRVLLFWAGGNQDPQAFDDPDTIRFDRLPNRHLSFGVGSHRCVGSHFVRRGMPLILRRVLERIPDYVVDVERSRRNPVQALNSGWSSLPCEFSPTPSTHTPFPSLTGLHD